MPIRDLLELKRWRGSGCFQMRSIFVFLVNFKVEPFCIHDSQFCFVHKRYNTNHNQTGWSKGIENGRITGAKSLKKRHFFQICGHFCLHDQFWALDQNCTSNLIFFKFWTFPKVFDKDGCSNFFFKKLDSSNPKILFKPLFFLALHSLYLQKQSLLIYILIIFTFINYLYLHHLALKSVQFSRIMKSN